MSSCTDDEYEELRKQLDGFEHDSEDENFGDDSTEYLVSFQDSRSILMSV
jgi:hypothetical protein